MDAKLTLSRRDIFGKKAKSLISDGMVLGNIFGKGRDSIAVFGEQREVESVVSKAGKNHPIEITLNDRDNLLVLVNEVERDYISNRIHHVSFQTIIRGQKVNTEVPLHLTGDAPAEKLGLIIVTMIDSVEVEAIPSKIPGSIEISQESLTDDGDSIHISDIPKIDDVEIMVDETLLVAKVETPRSQIEEDEEEGEGEEGEGEDAADVPSEHGGSEESTEEENSNN